MKKMSLADRMKTFYELTDKHYLTRRTPVIIRIDGKAFSSYTKAIHAEKPFSEFLSQMMISGAKNVIKNSQCVKCCYIQSDEASFLLTDYDDIDTECWFKYEIQKLSSVSASLFTAGAINYLICNMLPNETVPRFPAFDARSFNIPKFEVINYFIWRQMDWVRNSVSMFSRQYLSTKQMHKQTVKDLLSFLVENGTPWSKIEDKWKNGVFIIKDENTRQWVKKNKCPIFTKEREIIDNLVYID